MAKVELLNPLTFRGSRFERGSIVELSDDEQAAIDPTDIAPATEVVETPVEEVEPVETDETTDTEDDKPKRARKAK